MFNQSVSPFARSPHVNIKKNQTSNLIGNQKYQEYLKYEDMLKVQEVNRFSKTSDRLIKKITKQIDKAHKAQIRIQKQLKKTIDKSIVHIDKVNILSKNKHVNDHESNFKSHQQLQGTHMSDVLTIQKTCNHDKDTIIVWNEQQEEFLHLVCGSSANVFLTGNAGSGKSFVMKHAIQLLKKKIIVNQLCDLGLVDLVSYSQTLNEQALSEFLDYYQFYFDKRVSITASTGTAAVLIHGTTLHLFAGFGIHIPEHYLKMSIEMLAMHIHYRIIYKWRSLHTLFIDEISMIDPVYFERLSIVVSILRQNTLPFGGIQLILVGDFCQLKAVKKKGTTVSFSDSRVQTQSRTMTKDASDMECASSQSSYLGSDIFDEWPQHMHEINHSNQHMGSQQFMYTKNSNDTTNDMSSMNDQQYLFETVIWRDCQIHEVYLTQNYRQGTDQRYFDFLNRLRANRITMQDIIMIKTRIMPFDQSVILHNRRLRESRVSKNSITSIENSFDPSPLGHTTATCGFDKKSEHTSNTTMVQNEINIKPLFICPYRSRVNIENEKHLQQINDQITLNYQGIIVYTKLKAKVLENNMYNIQDNLFQLNSVSLDEQIFGNNNLSFTTRANAYQDSIATDSMHQPIIKKDNYNFLLSFNNCTSKTHAQYMKKKHVTDQKSDCDGYKTPEGFKSMLRPKTMWLEASRCFYQMQISNYICIYNFVNNQFDLKTDVHDYLETLKRHTSNNTTKYGGKFVNRTRGCQTHIKNQKLLNFWIAHDQHTSIPTQNVEHLLNYVRKMMKPYIQLKIGTNVMLKANLNIKRGLVNGMKGVVVGFYHTQTEKIIYNWHSQSLIDNQWRQVLESLGYPIELAAIDTHYVNATQMPHATYHLYHPVVWFQNDVISIIEPKVYTLNANKDFLNNIVKTKGFANDTSFHAATKKTSKYFTSSKNAYFLKKKTEGFREKSIAAKTAESAMIKKSFQTIELYSNLTQNNNTLLSVHSFFKKRPAHVNANHSITQVDLQTLSTLDCMSTGNDNQPSLQHKNQDSPFARLPEDARLKFKKRKISPPVSGMNLDSYNTLNSKSMDRANAPVILTDIDFEGAELFADCQDYNISLSDIDPNQQRILKEQLDSTVIDGGDDDDNNGYVDESATNPIVSRIIYEPCSEDRHYYYIQLPLDVCAAVTIHKCQGQTCTMAHLSLKHCFESNQAYVALSRVQSLDQLTLQEDFDENCLQMDSKVVKYYELLEKNAAFKP